MDTMPHGGDIETYIERYGSAPLDHSANTNPFGMSPLARQAIIDALDTADRYPDPYCRTLRAALEAHEGVPAGYILCGNGAADLIFRLVLAVQPGVALIPAPTFSEYEEALRQTGCEVRHHTLKEECGFMLGEDILPCITEEVDILFLCEPNNPTGLVAGPELMGKIAAACVETGTLLVVDECFGGFLEVPEECSTKRLLGELPGLVILKAFTKLYGMAGVRLGYLLCSDEALLARVEKAGQHWPVSSLAQAAGVAALQDGAWLRRTLGNMAEEKCRLAVGLSALGQRVYPSQANYLFFYSAFNGLGERLAEEGVLIRDCANYHGIRPGFYRVAVRTRDENTRLLAAMARVLEGQNGRDTGRT